MITTCKECGGKVSTTATACPHCGHQGAASVLQRRRRRNPYATGNQGEPGSAMVWAILGLLICGPLCIVGYTQSRPGSAARIVSIVGLVMWGLAVLGAGLRMSAAVH